MKPKKKLSKKQAWRKIRIGYEKNPTGLYSRYICLNIMALYYQYNAITKEMETRMHTDIANWAKSHKPYWAGFGNIIWPGTDIVSRIAFCKEMEKL